MIKATCSPSYSDLCWIAGFLEGEGTFNFSPKRRCLQVAAVQKNREPLKKLLKFLGGTLYENIMYSGTQFTKGKAYVIPGWQVSGERARSICMTLYSFMSEERKKQIKQALYPEWFGVILPRSWQQERKIRGDI